MRGSGGCWQRRYREKPRPHQILAEDQRRLAEPDRVSLTAQQRGNARQGRNEREGEYRRRCGERRGENQQSHDRHHRPTPCYPGSVTVVRLATTPISSVSLLRSPYVPPMFHMSSA